MKKDQLSRTSARGPTLLDSLSGEPSVSGDRCQKTRTRTSGLEADKWHEMEFISCPFDSLSNIKQSTRFAHDSLDLRWVLDFPWARVPPPPQHNTGFRLNLWGVRNSFALVLRPTSHSNSSQPRRENKGFPVYERQLSHGATDTLVLVNWMEGETSAETEISSNENFFFFNF